MTVTGIDRGAPITSGELLSLANWGVSWVGSYVGGINNGGRGWTPTHFDRLRKQGVHILPIYVGQNICPGCASYTPSASLGQSDGAEAVRDAQKYGCTDGPLCFDLEYDSWWSGPHQATLDYANAWCGVVAQAGYHPVWYGPSGMVSAWHPPMPVGYWLARWDGVGDISNFPNAAAFAGLGIQFSDNWHGWDASHSTLEWWNGASPMPDVIGPFATGHSVSKGFGQYWQHHGGVNAFGLPLSDEYDTADEHGPVRRQWFERAVFEWRPNQYPDNWDTLPVLLGDLVRDGSPKLAELTADAKAHTSAF